MSDIAIQNTDKGRFTAGRVVYYLLGVIEVLLAFRLIFKFLGANPGSGFVSFIYGVSGTLSLPFTAIFRSAATPGLETKAVFEPSTIIAMVVYAVIAWGIVKLFFVVRENNEDQM